MCPITEMLSLHASKWSNTSIAFGNVSRVSSSSFASCINASNVSNMIKAASPDRHPSIRHSSSKLTPLLSLRFIYNFEFKKKKDYFSDAQGGFPHRSNEVVFAAPAWVRRLCCIRSLADTLVVFKIIFANIWFMAVPAMEVCFIEALMLDWLITCLP